MTYFHPTCKMSSAGPNNPQGPTLSNISSKIRMLSSKLGPGVDEFPGAVSYISLNLKTYELRVQPALSGGTGTG